ncbi:MurR/RpiR family transcriptional regulator [Pontibacillus litoralis]|uniref:Transcriptional regulator n=1 Tax=Pontibacillus litoralis JSM 072002 TaxID=1385512 RepID=A0A0A5G0L4_9BACI|nr:MurR/RpiR family transcriptional regulator [Pontibacillus litoralis]KGX86646.1 hypothetical protein N784_04415 [Pontibacillus litoralis JSM 072002]
MNVLTTIEENYQQLSMSQQKVAYVIIQHLDEITLLSAKKIGEKANVSEATVLRLAKILGYPNFKEFQRDLQASLLKERTLRRMNAIKQNDEASWLQSHYDSEIENLTATKLSNQEKEITDVAKSIMNASHIYLAGWRMGLSLTSPFSYILKIMYGAVTQIPQGEIAEYSTHFSNKDILIISAFPRYCTETKKVVETAKKQGVTIIVFTDSPLSPFVPLATTSLFAKTVSNSFLDSYTAPVAIMNAIIYRISQLDYNRIQKNLTKMEQQWKYMNIEYNEK